MSDLLAGIGRRSLETEPDILTVSKGKKDALASTLIASLVSRGYTIASQSSAQGSDMHMGNELVFTLIRQPSAADKGQAALDRAQKKKKKKSKEEDEPAPPYEEAKTGDDDGTAGGWV